MRHTVNFSNTIRSKMLLPALAAAVVLLGSAGLRSNAIASLWAFLVDPPEISSSAQCNCLNNATNLANGQFLDTITILSDPGEVWTITAAAGLFQPTSPAPPAAPVVVPLGTTIPETAPGSGVYRLVVRHVDAIGFTVTVDNGIGDVLTRSSTCYYPNPVILNLNFVYCVSTLPVTLQGTAGPGISGTGFFTIDGVPATVFDPLDLGPGNYIVRYTFNAGAGVPNTPGDPACTSFVEQEVIVVDIPPLAAPTQINIPMNSQCRLVITPDLILTNFSMLPCPDDYNVTVFDVPGNPIGDTIGSEWVGFTLRARVTTDNGGFFVETLLNIFDDIRPTITCPANTTRAVVTQTLQNVNGALTNADPTLVLSNHSCFLGQTNPAMGNHRYDTYTFTVNAQDDYILELDPLFGRAVGVLYQGAFNPAFPCMNVLDMADDGVLFIMPDSLIRISATLLPNQTYTLLTSSQQPAVTGAYQWKIYSNGPGLVNNLPFQMVRDTFDLVCNDTDSLFGNPASLLLTGNATATDNCSASSQINISFTDSRQNFGDCGNQVITRTFRAQDPSGNFRTCQQTITVRKPRISDLNFPPISTVIECSIGFQTTVNGNPHPSATGYPYIETAMGTYLVNQVFCNLAASWQDEPRVLIDNNPNVYSFVRRWTVLDLCNPGQLSTYNQIIRVDDFSPPIITCAPTIDLNGDGIPDPPAFSTENTTCTAVVQIPMPVITDACTDFTFETTIVTDIQVPILGPQGQILGFNTQTIVLDTIYPGQPLITDNIPVGNHRFRYVATDRRGNMSQVECPFVVFDGIEPTVVCDDNLIVSIGTNSYGRVFVQDVNEGSSDNCGIATMEVRRLFTQDPSTCVGVTPYYSAWGQFVEVGCCDVGRTILIELRVTDVYGNQNSCVTELTVRDNIRPICMAPPSRSVDCDTLPESFNPSDTVTLRTLFGTPLGMDNCSNVVVKELDPIVNIGTSGAGTIIRRFRARDASGNESSNTCQQIITVNMVHDYTIFFPPDAEAECGLPDADTLVVESSGCSNIAVSVTNETFVASGGACYKIFRTYRVINWNEYSGSGAPTIISRDEDCDGTAGDEGVWLLRRPNQTYIDRTRFFSDNLPPANTRGLACGGPSNPAGYWRTVQSTGYWQYTQVIKVFDNQRPTATFQQTAPFCTSGMSCNAVVSVPFTVNEICSPNDVTVQVFLDAFSDGIQDGPVTGSNFSGTYPNYVISGTYPIGSHRFIVNFRDGCGNTNSVTIPFSVIDCVSPSPICITGLSRPLMPLPPNTDADGDGDIDIAALTILATDFVTSPISDCSGPVRLSINRPGTTPSPTLTSLVLTCDHLGTNIVEIYAWDNANNPTRIQPNGSVGGPNFGFCQAVVTVQANNQVNCSGPNPLGLISGGIFTERGDPVQAVNVNLTGYMTQSVTTETDGNYMLEDLPSNQTYSVTPVADQNAANGVSTFDIIMITRHILGTQLLDSPYKLIAADVNNSRSISTLDIIQIRRVILGLANNFPNSTSWRFIDADFVFPNPANPWQTQFPEVVQVGNLQGTLNNRDFIAVKMGDVNGSAVVNSNSVDDRNVAGVFTLYSDMIALEKDKELNVPIRARNWQGIGGFQMTVEFDADQLELSDVVYGVLGTEHIGTALTNQGMVTVSWNRQGNPYESGADMSSDGEVLFWLSFRSKTNGQLKEALAISSRYTTAEAYDPQGELLDIELEFEFTQLAEERFELYQNQPNPFNGQTMIGFRLPEDDYFTMRIQDASGKVLKEQRGYFTAGYNQMWLHAADLPASGVLYYTLTSGTHSATRKMVVIK